MMMPNEDGTGGMPTSGGGGGCAAAAAKVRAALQNERMESETSFNLSAQAADMFASSDDFFSDGGANAFLDARKGDSFAESFGQVISGTQMRAEWNGAMEKKAGKASSESSASASQNALESIAGYRTIGGQSSSQGGHPEYLAADSSSSTSTEGSST